jgi:hypothetical protein
METLSLADTETVVLATFARYLDQKPVLSSSHWTTGARWT